MDRRSGKFLAGTAGGLLLAALAYWLCRHRVEREPPASAPKVSATNSARLQTDEPVATGWTTAGLGGELYSVSKDLESHKDAEKARWRLAELRQKLTTASAQEAGAAIRSFLDTKADATTQQGFKVNASGFWTKRPRYRCMEFKRRLLSKFA